MVSFAISRLRGAPAPCSDRSDGSRGTGFLLEGSLNEGIRMEKLIEAMYDDLAARCDPEMRRKCPMLRRIADYLIWMKTENNGRIITEFGLMDDEGWDCGCR